jgi:hypothetical protein
VTTTSKDKTSKTYLLDRKLTLVDKIESFNGEKLFLGDEGNTLYRRIDYSSCGRFLYLCCGVTYDGEGKRPSYCVHVYHYPFKSENLYGRIGPLDYPPIKIISTKTEIVILTKKSLYFVRGGEVLFCVKDVSFHLLTDGCLMNGIFYFSSIDGFVYSLRTGESGQESQRDIS